MINSTPISILDSVKFRGLRFHANHSWQPHITEIKKECRRTLSAIKYLSLAAPGKPYYPYIMLSLDQFLTMVPPSMGLLPALLNPSTHVLKLVRRVRPPVTPLPTPYPHSYPPPTEFSDT